MLQDWIVGPTQKQYVKVLNLSTPDEIILWDRIF